MKWKRLLAAVGLILILSIYAVALISAFLNSPEAKSWLMAAIVSSVIVPVIFYAAWLAYRVLKPENPENETKPRKNN